MSMMYHAASKNKIPYIVRNGFFIGTYITRLEALADYYVETIEDEGNEAVILCFDSTDINLKLNPDFAGLEEPISTVLKSELGIYLDEDELWDEWEKTNQTGAECMELIGSARLGVGISPDRILVSDFDGFIPLLEYSA